jgi:ubiquinone/menaquinone biosynthesis C-methylase UbiE
MKNIKLWINDRLKWIYVKYFVGYENPHKYWDTNYKLSFTERWTKEETEHWFNEISLTMQKYDCENVLEIGCGDEPHLKDLKGYVGSDFSLTALKKSKLQEFILCDVTKHIPVPDKSFDALLSMAVLLHVPTKDIDFAIKEISRVTKKLVMLSEPSQIQNENAKITSHCFKHDYISLFKKYFDGNVIFLNQEDQRAR